MGAPQPHSSERDANPQACSPGDIAIATIWTILLFALIAPPVMRALQGRAIDFMVGN
jgi:hypothetical protein